VVGLQRGDEAGGVVEQAVDAQGAKHAADAERGSVADVAVPERKGALGLPAQPRVRAGPVAQRHAIDASLGEQAADGGRAHHARRESPVEHQGAQDQRDGG